jgi:hypothetical protein
LAHQADATPTPKTQRNFTDPDSHIMRGNGEVLQGYNFQAVVDGDHQVIVAVGVSNPPPDVEHLEPMLERTIVNTCACPKTFLADAGYWSEENAETCTPAQTDPHIANGQRARRETAKRHKQQQAASQRIWILKNEWPASCAPRKAVISTPSAKQHPSQSLARPKRFGACGAS